MERNDYIDCRVCQLHEDAFYRYLIQTFDKINKYDDLCNQSEFYYHCVITVVFENSR